MSHSLRAIYQPAAQSAASANTSTRAPRSARLRECGSEVAGSNFNPELVSITEIAVGEAVQETEAGDATEPDGNGWGAHYANTLVETELRNSYANGVDRKETRVGAAEMHLSQPSAAECQAIILVQDEFKKGLVGSTPGVRQHISRRSSAPGRYAKIDLNHRATKV
jgi:hypothetical protein